ncbi:MAG: RIP metalloprotease RseP [Verrucomicrobia bacterium]|nr:RIP metalloprotease RseP [Verrucomicrobiota bacterium]
MDSLPPFLRVLIILIQVVVLFNLLIIVHELGHFLAARWRGLVVEKFGIWFGKPLWKKTINGVEYSLGSIPAGGFVALPQMAPMEAIEGEGTIKREELPPVSPLDKIIVAFAGPLFSFLLAVAFACIVLVVGKPVKEADGSLTIGYIAPESPAAKSGLRVGDRILEVDNRPVKTWSGMNDSVVWNVVSSEGKTIPVKVQRGSETLTFEPEPAARAEQSGFGRSSKRQLLMLPAAKPMIGKVKPGSAVEAAGFKPNDVITHVDGKEVLHLNDLEEAQRARPGQPLPVTVERDKQSLQLSLPYAPPRVRSVIAKSPADLAGIKAEDTILTADGRPMTTTEFSKLAQEKVNQPIALSVKRGDQTLTLTVTPLLAVQSNQPEPRPKRAMIGMMWASDYPGIEWDEWGRMKVTHPGVWEQVVSPIRTMANTFSALVSSKSELSLRDLSGPVGIMRIYYLLFESEQGWRLALWFSVFMNVNLALMNMLPIPVLDGGHITLSLIEMMRRKPVNVRVLEYVQTACALVIIGFMLYVTVFDVMDLPFLKRGGGSPELIFLPPDAPAPSPAPK